MANNTASTPYPPIGDTNGTSPDVWLSWTAGDNAAPVNGHDVYFGTDQAAVLNGGATVHIGQQSDTSYAPPGLAAGLTYYWRVDEVNPNVAPYRWTGTVWSFTVFDGTGQPAGFGNGYAAWCVDTMTPVTLNDGLPGNSPAPPAAVIKLAQCESAGFQVAIQPAAGRRLDHVRLVMGNLNSGGNTLAVANISWQLVGLVTYGGVVQPDILLPVDDFNIAIGNTHSMLVTVTVPANTPAGLYTGAVTVKSDSGPDTIVNVSATVYGFAIPAANTVGAMNLRTTWTLNDFGTAAQYQAYGDLLLSYRICPDNIYRNATPDIPTLEHWYDRGLNTISVYKADNLWHTGDLQNQGVDAFFTALAASTHGPELRAMAQFYGYDEADISRYGDAAGQSGMRATYGTIKATYPDIPTTTTCHMYLPPWADPIGDMVHYECDWMCAEQSYYSYADGELLRGTVDPALPNPQRYQYWVYSASYAVGRYLSTRTSFWSLFQQKVDGLLYYSVNGWTDLPNPAPIDPNTGPMTNYVFVPGQKSAAVLIYCGTTGPLASMRLVNVRDGMQDWEYLHAIGHYDTDGVTRLGKIASVETARELAEQISLNWITDAAPGHAMSARDVIAAWLIQPYVAKYPTPEHRTKGVSSTPTLTWQADSANVDSFNVYFGTDRNAMLSATTVSPEFRGNQVAASFQPPGRLATNTQYYWRIDEVVGAQVYAGYVWSFNCSYGLVGWWKFDETTGAVAKDSSPLGRDAAINNANHVTGILNNGLQFAGAGSVSIPVSVLSTVDRQITIAFWLCGAQAQPQGQVLFEALAADGSTVLRGRVPFADSIAYFEAGVSDAIGRPLALTQARNRWQYWTFTKNADTGHMKIYFNGALWADFAANTQGMGTAAAFTLGSKCDGSLGYEGTVDELRVYDSELQAADIATLYQIGQRRGDCGLMGWWRFDELSGTTVKDWSDLQNHGSIHNPNPPHDAGKIGNCLTCNGPNDYVDVPVNGMIFSDPAVTLSLWTYGDASLPTVSNYGSIAVSALKTDGTTALLASIPASNGAAFFRAGGDSGADSKLTGVLVPSAYKGQWNHWVFSRESSGASNIYLNGGLISTDLNGSSDVCGTIGQFRIGTGCTGYDAYLYVGKLDEVRLYNYALSASDISNLYTADLSAFSGEVGRWKFDENEGTTAADATPFGNDGLIDNANWSSGRIGSALSFNGISGSVNIPAASLASLDKHVTVSVWLNGAPAHSGDNWVFDALAVTDGPTMRANVGRLTVTFDAGFGGAGHYDEVAWDAVQSGPTGLAGTGPHILLVPQWSHWAFTKNAVSGAMNIYLNGSLWQSSAGKYRALTLAAEFKIGSRADGTLTYAGIIDDLRIYNLELNATDIQNLFLDCPPLPNPMTWSKVPQALGLTSISMTATVASHPNGVEYYFACVAGGGHDSGWQSSPAYTDVGLAARTQYTYQVKAREMGPNANETGYSSAHSATTRRIRLPPRIP